MVGIFGDGGLVAIGLLAAGRAAADTAEIKIARQYTMGELPLMIVEHNKLIEKQAAIMGLGETKVRWVAPGKSGAVDALLAGEVDLAPVEIGQFITAWDRRLGTAQEVRGLAALAQIPYILVARNPAIKTIRDFSEHDRIAVPVVKNSGPALMLEMAAAQEWGADHYDKLDDLVRARSDEEATFELGEGKSELDAHFSRWPFADDELGSPAVHRVMDSFDIAGPHSDGVLTGLVRFYGVNSKLCAAVFGALQEADALIKDNPGQAAEIYVSMVGSKEISVEDFSDLIGDPDVAYIPAPAGVGHLVDLMARIKRIKHRPESWKELFFIDAQGSNGS